ncbi:hypothetical protein PTTG_28605 [Puccinia triticina 1-1 BBBD Race 1]|uniref:Uncharacterized protein n=1 Tax=Puccinia triticina (isolate 1-1 / race 1 (BBBD)) TaxID=630390 RepID=A0A180GAY4_PUCT1|nr:hypothetical protein PTTG_28605 [Puccinia triticina 1-1 BBBD Race 1]WAR61124.1 hypothetical protein PtB15_13B376 [Puccinia triticina]
MKLVYYTTSVLVLLIAMLHVNLVSSSPVTDEVSTIGSQGETQGNTRLNPEARPTEKPRRRASPKIRGSRLTKIMPVLVDWPPTNRPASGLSSGNGLLH